MASAAGGRPGGWRGAGGRRGEQVGYQEQG